MSGGGANRSFGRDRRVRSSFACDPALTQGRLHAEPESDNRTVYERDRDRIIHCAAFRQLKQKTQVFVAHAGDSFRTRLTHSLEVAQIARSASRTLGLDEDLAEALALGHDLGHPPFGHAGEDALQACMAEFGGFDHNAHTLRIVTTLERKYAEFDGLNLTWETLEGLVKRNGPLMGPHARPRPLPRVIADHARIQDLALDTFPSVEAQIAAVADDIAYNNHDIDDGLRAGLLSVAQLRPLPLVGAIVGDLERRYPGLEQERLIHELTRRLISAMIHDLVDETRRRLGEAGIVRAEEVRRLERPVAGFSLQMEEIDRAIRRFLFSNMYRHYLVNRMTHKARRVVRDLFALFLEQPGLLPPAIADQCSGPGERATAHAICDFIAGMTDRGALELHGQLFNQFEKGY